MVKHRKGAPTQQLADEYQSGATTVELASKYDMTPSGVNGRLTRAGVTLRKAQRRSPADKERFRQGAIALYRDGFSIADIADKLGGERGRSTIQRILVAEKVPLRRHGTRSPTVKIPTDPLRLGYLAGLFDGEGNLQFRAKKCRSGNETTGCKISIYSTTPAVMGWLVANVGGKARWDYKRQEGRGWLPCGIWEVSRAQDVLRLLIALEPHLLVKKKLAIKSLKHLREKCHYDSPPAIIQSSRGEP